MICGGHRLQVAPEHPTATYFPVDVFETSPIEFSATAYNEWFSPA